MQNNVDIAVHEHPFEYDPLIWFPVSRDEFSLTQVM